MTVVDAKIGEVARRTGLTERTLRYYEELGLLAPRRDAGGQRHYDADALARLYRIRLLRALGTPVAGLSGALLEGDLLPAVHQHLAAVDEQLTRASRLRERVRAVEAALLRHTPPTDEELLAVLGGMASDEPGFTRRLTLLVYADLEGMVDFLVGVFGLTAGPLERGDDGRVQHAELYVGDGLLWLHRESAEHGLASPRTLGAATACMAVSVDDVDATYARMRDAGAEIAYPPTDMPYGVRELGARDPEGGLWSFMQELDPQESAKESRDG